MGSAGSRTPPQGDPPSPALCVSRAPTVLWGGTCTWSLGLRPPRPPGGLRSAGGKGVYSTSPSGTGGPALPARGKSPLGKGRVSPLPRSPREPRRRPALELRPPVLGGDAGSSSSSPDLLHASL